MSEYIKNWLDIIENMNNDNTYKSAWGRALLELIIAVSYTHLNKHTMHMGAV